MLFDLTDLRLFIYIAELKSLTRSAERIHMSLSAASSRVKELEARFGMRLIYRENKGICLSPAGETFLHHAQQFLQQVERLTSDLQQYNNGIKGHIRIFANTTAVTEFMPEVLGAFLEKYPHVNISLEERLNQGVLQGILEGTADIGIVAGPIHNQGLEIINFSTDRLVLVTAVNHPLGATGRITFAEAIPYEQIGLYEGSSLQHFLHQIVSESGKVLRLRIQVRSFEAMCRMVETNVGIAVMPQSAALRHSLTMQLSVIELDEPWALRERSIVVQKLDVLPLYARELVDFIQASTSSSAIS